MLPFVEANGIHLFAADRAGYGGTFGRGPSTKYVSGLREVLLHHGAREYDIVGVSGGAPWAHVMASLFPREVRSMTIISGLCPYNAETRRYFNRFHHCGLWLRGRLPAPVSEAVVVLALKKFQAEKALNRFLPFLDEPDRNILSEPEFRQLLLRSMAIARAQGGRGIAFDADLYRRNWLTEVCDREALRRVRTYYFHGLRDRVLDAGMARWMHRMNPHARVRYFEDEGHYSLGLRQASVIMSDVIAAA